MRLSRPVLLVLIANMSLAQLRGDEAPASSSAPDPRHSPTVAGHLEMPNMPRILHDGQRFLSQPMPRGALTTGPFTSVQVNVAPGGLNIIGDAANEPSIAVNRADPTRVAIGWRQFDSVASDFRQAGRAFSTDAGQTWTAPAPLTPGEFRSDPVLYSASDGRMYYFSLNGSLGCDMFSSTNGGQTWSGPRFAFGGDKQWMTVDLNPGPSNGNIYTAWSFVANCCGTNVFSRSFDGGLTFRNPVSLGTNIQWGQLTVGPDGTVFVAGRNASNIRVAFSANAKNPAVSTPTFTNRTVDLGGSLVFTSALNPDGLVGQVSIKADISDGPFGGNVYVAASVERSDGSDPLDLMIARSTDNGLTWQPPVRVNQFGEQTDGSSQWFGMIDVAPNGRIDAVWNDTRLDQTPLPAFSHLRYAASFDGGQTWRYDIPVSPEFDHRLGYPVQRKIGDYHDIQSDNTGTSIAYSATFNGEQDVYFLRIAFLDCNNNGTLDVEEIDAGLVADCNDNDVPDACEIATQYTPDCNGNAVPDSCDIDNGVEQDCNANGLPDSCEIIAGTQTDCDANGVLDVCQLADPSADCNDNDQLDVCEIASGAVPDCNANGLPDECDLLARYDASSPQLSPIGADAPQSWTIVSPPGAISTVRIDLRVRGDFNVASEYLDVSLNGLPLGSFFAMTTDCPSVPETATMFLTAEQFNMAIGGGDAVFSFVASAAVNPFLCTPSSFVEAALSYATDESNSEDKNGNGIPDECERLRGDMDCNGTVSVTDVGPFVLALTNPAGYAAQFPDCDITLADMNQDGGVSVGDIGPFVALLTGGR